MGEPAVIGASIGSPYKGLAPYTESEEDARLFFGRDTERQIISANLLGSRLTLLYGASGSGKTSVLRAGVLSQLRAAAAADGSDYVVVFFNTWPDDPAVALRNAVASAVVASVPDTPPDTFSSSETLPDLVARINETCGSDVLLILDQFENYFAVQNPAPFATALTQMINRTNLRANILISIREDELAKLDRFKGAISSLFNNYLRLRHLERQAARDAITKPIAVYNALCGESITVDPALVEEVLSATRVGQVALDEDPLPLETTTEDEPAREDDHIEAPYMQLVMQQVWKEARRTPSSILTGGMLEALGGAKQIVRNHVHTVLSSLSAEEQERASSVFAELVTQSGVRMRYSVKDLGGKVGLDDALLRPMLERLSGENVRLLHRVKPTAATVDDAYEIVHDMLSRPVQDWRKRRADRMAQQQRDQRIRRLKSVLIAMSIVAVLAVLGFSLSAMRESRRREELNRRVAELSSPQDPVGLAIVAAWSALTSGDYAEAMAQADRCVGFVKSQADADQALLIRKGTPLPPEGALSEDQMDEVWHRRQLNAAGMCYVIKGNAAERRQLGEQARQAWAQAIQYPHARAWSPLGFFWSPAKAADEKLRGR